MGRAASFSEGLHFIVESLPILIEGVGAGDDNVDFVRTIFDRLVDFFKALFEWAESRWESGADGGDRNAGALEVADGVGDVGVIDADGTGVDFGEPKSGESFAAEGVFGFGAKSMDVAGSVITAEGCEVDAFDGADEECGLVVFFDRAPFGESVGAAVDGGSVDGK